MGTTKDPEGFRRHSSGRRHVLGGRAGEGPTRRGCALGSALVLVGLVLGAAVLSLGGERGTPVAGAAPSPGAVARTTGVPVDVEGPGDGQRPAAPRVAQEPVDVASPDPRAAVARASVATSGPGVAASLRIQLVRGWSEVPLADAELFWIGRDELDRLRREGLRITTVEFEPVLRSHGRRARSDVQGHVHVAADGCHLLVPGEEWTRELEVQPAGEGPTRVRVFAPRTLAVDVVDWRGRPAHGFPLELWRVDAAGAPRARLRSTFTSRVSGVLRLEDVDALLQPGLERAPEQRRSARDAPLHVELPALEPTRVRVALDAELAPNAWQEIDLALDPLPHVRLQLPPLGELRVVVAQSDGSPVGWDGYVELRSGDGNPNPHTLELVEGRAEFANLRFGSELSVTAVRAEGALVARGEELSLAPLTPEQPEREVVLADVPASPTLLVRPILPEGLALPGAWVSVNIQTRRALSADERHRIEQQFEGELAGRIEGRIEGSIEGRIEGRTTRFSGRPTGLSPAVREVPTHTMDSWTRILRCDARGQLEVPLPESLITAGEGRLALSLVRDGVTLSSQPISLERGASWHDLDLGPVRLEAPGK